jgi:hypothetical protein
MRYGTKAVLTVLAVLLLAGGAYAIHKIYPAESTPPLPGANAEKLNEYIVYQNPYRSWDLWPGKGKLYEGGAPHGMLLTTFINETAFYSIWKKEPFKDGAIIAKENYTKEKKFVALTVMYKIKGYNPKAGDWFWVKYAPDGSVQAAGKVGACIECHSQRKDNDYILTAPVVK